MSKIYISGPITIAKEGTAGNKDKFRDMVLKLHRMNLGTPISPRRHRIPPWLSLEEQPNEVWIHMMKLAVSDLMEADSMVVLDGWEESKGCCVEVELSKLLRIPVFDERLDIIYDPTGNDHGILDELGYGRNGPPNNPGSVKALLTDTGRPPDV